MANPLPMLQLASATQSVLAAGSVANGERHLQSVLNLGRQSLVRR